MKILKKALALILCGMLLMGILVSCSEEREPESEAETTETSTPVIDNTADDGSNDDDGDDNDGDGQEPAPDASTAIAITSLSDITDKRGNYYLTADIGTADAPNTTTVEEFAGVLDGKNFKIYSSRVLFEELKMGAQISNLTIEGSISSEKPSQYGAALANLAKEAVTIKNVTNNASVTIVQTDDEITYVGGLIARASGGADFENCTNNGTLTVNQPETAVNKAVYAGGIVGSNAGKDNIAFDGCTNTGALVSTSKHGTCLFGGMTAQLSPIVKATINNCKNTVTGKATTPANSGSCKIGGMVAWLDKNDAEYVISGCVNEADLTAAAIVGGIVADANALVKISDCVNKGSMTVASNDTALSTSKLSGGIVAKLYGDAGSMISNCMNFGDITSENYTGSNQYPQKDAGGIVGFMDKATVFTDCANYGDVSAFDGAGGMLGRCHNANATFTRCLNTGAISGQAYTGAIVGRLANQEIVITITDCYAIDTESDAVGAVQAKISYTYVYTGVDNATAYEGAKADTALKGETAATTLAGFDFTNVWQVVDNDYPTLK